MRQLLSVLAVSLLGCAASACRLAAQATPVPPVDSECDYRRCALSIAPAWNGLALVEGQTGRRTANLNFFWPRSLAPVFVGSDSAARYGARAVKVRRGAAVLTDVGAVVLGYALAQRASTGRLEGGARVAAGVGAAAIFVSVPLHFAADGYLSRAVWWHNARYAR
jgi:hypothetical protein